MVYTNFYIISDNKKVFAKSVEELTLVYILKIICNILFIQ